MENVHPIWLIVVALGLAFVPLVLGLVSSYLKISIVLNLLRSGLGTQQVPSNMVIMGIALALSIFVMAPVVEQSMNSIKDKDLKIVSKNPTLASLAEFAPALVPWQAFLLAHCSERELRSLWTLAQEQSGSPQTEFELSKVGFRILLPAFALSELKQAFVMGFVLLLPFLVIDLVIANILVGLGMFMVSPQVVALPVKLIIFFLADGWLLLSEGLIRSYR